MKSATIAVCFALLPSVLFAETRIVFPDDECVINVNRDFGAKGDGTTDDTDALQAALDAGSGSEVKQHKIVLLPNGTYRVRNTLVVNRDKKGSGLNDTFFTSAKSSPKSRQPGCFAVSSETSR